MNLLDQTIGSLACDIPGATRIFHHYKLDFCCGGHKLLGEVARRRHVDTDELVAALQQLQDTAAEGKDWRTAPPPELIQHILHNFHEKHRLQLPELLRLARRVEEVHGERPQCPLGLADHLAAMYQEMESHMMKEEQVLFPLITRGYLNPARGPITMMRFEHEQHGEALAELERLTHDITPPPNACNTWRALYAGLSEFRNDLMQHIHLENNILFLRAEQEEAFHG